MWSDSADVISRKYKTLKETTQVLIRSTGLQWQTRTRGLTRHFSQEKVNTKMTKMRSIIAEKHKIIISEVFCADRWNWDADCRKCRQEKQAHVRTHDKLGQSRKWTLENPQLDAFAQRQAQFGEPVDCCSNYSWRIQHDTNSSTF